MSKQDHDKLSQDSITITTCDYSRAEVYSVLYGFPESVIALKRRRLSMSSIVFSSTLFV